MAQNTPTGARVPDACTLPVAEQEPRLAEFDDLFAASLRAQRRLSPTRLRWTLDPAAEALALDLAAREGACCSFFTFTFSGENGGLLLDVEVPPSQAAVLDGLASRASAVLHARP